MHMRKAGGMDKMPNGGGPYVLNVVIHLTGEEETPPVPTDAKGVAHLRVTADKVLYSKIIVTNLEEDDFLLFAHVHAGAFGQSGPARIFFGPHRRRLW